MCSGTIEIKLLSYANPDHRMGNGRCCEQGLEPKNCTKTLNNKGCKICTSQCDPQFRIELKQNSSQILFFNTSTIAYNDNFYFDDKINANITNPFAVKLDNLQVNTFFNKFDKSIHLNIWMQRLES